MARRRTARGGITTRTDSVNVSIPRVSAFVGPAQRDLERMLHADAMDRKKVHAARMVQPSTDTRMAGRMHR